MDAKISEGPTKPMLKMYRENIKLIQKPRNVQSQVKLPCVMAIFNLLTNKLKIKKRQNKI